MKPRHATVVIGANFGDEGKGLAVDSLVARDSDAAVIRFNGGAQAGHTVVAEDGRRHVFSHFGAGAFLGAATFLSRFFVVQPSIFAKKPGAAPAMARSASASGKPSSASSSATRSP